MTISIVGAGWITAKGYGTVNLGEEYLFAPDETLNAVAKTRIFGRPVKNFGRLDKVSRITVAAVCLALKDAGIDSSPECKQDIGIVGTNDLGSLETDTAYFRDFVDNGRKLARANLFIYTLPSSPMGEAAIHFGLTGPLLYTVGSQLSPAAALSSAAEMITCSEASMMLAGMTCGDTGIYFVLGESKGGGLCRVEEVLKQAGSVADVERIVTTIRSLKRG
jgi:3-oxoacyl-[acyl-carrier-protein] synthase II